MRLLALLTLLLAPFTNALLMGARDPTALLKAPTKAAASSCNESGTRSRKVVMEAEKDKFKLEKTERLGLDRPRINLYEQQKGFESRMKVSHTIAELRAKGMDRKAVKPQKKKPGA